MSICYKLTDIFLIQFLGANSCIPSRVISSHWQQVYFESGSHSVSILDTELRSQLQ
jgi:hypothetical protein